MGFAQMVVGDVCSVFHRQDLAQIVNYFLLHRYDRYRVKGHCSVQRQGSALHLRQCSVQRRGSALHLRQFSVQRRRGSGLLKSFAACSSCDLNICFIFFDWLLYSIFKALNHVTLNKHILQLPPNRNKKIKEV